MAEIAHNEVVSERVLKAAALWRQIVRLGRRFWPVLVSRLAILIMLIVVFTPLGAAAQGCAMCYRNAAASGVVGRAALRHGTLILLVPSMSVFFGILALIYRRRPGAQDVEVRRLPRPVADGSSGARRWD
jgi:hypothetical protein